MSASDSMPNHARRRLLLAGLAALPVAHALAAPPSLIAQAASSRVIVDNDFAGDPDGLVALAHQLLSPKTRTVLVTSSPLDAGLAHMAGLDAEALRDDPLPLVLACGGPLTNVAAALRMRPEVAGRMTLVWIGGTAASKGGTEYNLATDLAARFVFEESTLPILQIPAEEYRRFQVSVAELSSAFRPISPLSRWLYDQYRQLPPFVKLGGTLTFGDSPLVSATAFDPAACPFTSRQVRRLLDDGRYGDPAEGRQVRMIHSLDARPNLADFMALLRAHALGQQVPA